MGFLARLLGLGQAEGTGLCKHVPSQGSKHASTGPLATGSSALRSCDALALIHSPRGAETADADSDEDDGLIHAPAPIIAPTSSSSNLSRRRTAIDISPKAVQRLADKVAILESSHLHASFSGNADGVTHAELDSFYSDVQLIHRGRSTMVYRAREVTTSRRVVIKSYSSAHLTPSKRSNLDRQIRALKAATAVLGPQGAVVPLERVLENPGGTFLVMQACNGGTLIEAIANAGGKLPERQVAVKVAQPMLAALAQLHSHGIVHRDLKPEHLLIHNGSLRLGDFGSAACYTVEAAGTSAACYSCCHLQHEQQQVPLCQPGQKAIKDAVSAPAATTATGDRVSNSSGSCAVPPDAMNFRTGSMEYMAPEMLDKPTASEVFHLVIAKGIAEEDLPTYDSKVDIWSLGVVLYEALTGLQPFLADTAADMCSAIRGKVCESSAAAPYDDSAQQLVGEQPYHKGCYCGSKDGSSLPAFIQQLSISPLAKAFLAACLVLNPAQRPSAQQLLQHPWLKQMQANAVAAAATQAASRRQSLSSNAQSGAAVTAADKAAAVASTGAAACKPHLHYLAPSGDLPAVINANESAEHPQNSGALECLRLPNDAATIAGALTACDEALCHTQRSHIAPPPVIVAAEFLSSASVHDLRKDSRLSDEPDTLGSVPLFRALTSTSMELGASSSILRTSTQRFQPGSTLFYNAQ